MQSQPNSSSRILELVAGPFVSAISLIWPGDKIAEYLTAPDVRRQVWHACLASPACTFRPDAANADRLYDQLRFWRAKNLIVQAYACRPRGVIRALAQLGTKARSPEIYPLLIQVLERGGGPAKMVMHTQELSDASIETMAALPADTNWRTINALTSGQLYDAPESLALFAWTAQRLHQAWLSVDVSALLITANDPLHALQDRLIERDFPTPPWPGTNLLVSIRKGTELISTGTAFRNCLAERGHGVCEILKVLNGTKHFYVWKGKEPALIEIVRFADIGWYVSEARGRDNADITQEARRDIAYEFEVAANICTTRLLIRSGIYPCSHFWSEVMGGI